MSLSDRVVVMNRGSIEQIGTPEDVYFEPRSAFVAEFIGESNFLPGRLRLARDGGGPAVEIAPGLLLPCALPPGAAGRLREGQDVRLVLRASDVEVLPSSGQVGEDGLTATLTQRAFVGSTVRLYLTPPSGGPLLIADVPARAAAVAVQAGATLRLRWDPAAALVVAAP